MSKWKSFWLENIFDVLCVEIASQNIKARFLIKKRNRQHKSRIARRYENILVMRYVFFPADGDMFSLMVIGSIPHNRCQIASTAGELWQQKKGIWQIPIVNTCIHLTSLSMIHPWPMTHLTSMSMISCFSWKFHVRVGDRVACRRSAEAKIRLQ